MRLCVTLQPQAFDEMRVVFLLILSLPLDTLLLMYLLCPSHLILFLLVLLVPHLEYHVEVNHVESQRLNTSDALPQPPLLCLSSFTLFLSSPFSSSKSCSAV